MKRHALIAVIFTLTCSRAFAIFGVGDIVFDPANTAQVVNVLRQAEQQITTLSKIAGINTEQLRTLDNVLASVGKANDLAQFPRRATPNRILNVLKSFPGMENSGLGDLSKLFNSTGVLDVFMNQPVTEWNNMVRDPMHYFGDRLRNLAVQRIGEELGMTNPETRYVKWVTQMSDAQRHDNALKITLTASELLLDHWFKGVEQRRKSQQEFSAKVAADEQASFEAQTLNQQLAAGSAQVTTTNQILLTSLQSQQDAAAVQAMSQKNENELLETQFDREQMRRAMERTVNN